MGWTQQDIAAPGNWVMGEVQAGFTVDVFSNVTPDDLLAAARTKAVGWTPETIQWQRGVFGIGETLRIFGRATDQTPVSSIADQMAAAVNSFWLIAGASVTVSVSDSLVIPSTATSRDSLATALQWIAAAAIVAGIGYTIFQIRRTFQ